MRPHDGKRRRALGLVLLFGVTFLPNNVAVAGDDPVQVDIDADGTTVLEDELHGVWQAMHEENPEDPPDRIEIFVRELGGDDEEEHEGCKVAHSGGGENGDGGNGDDGQLALPARGPALLWCTLYAMPGYVNTISPTTEVVVFIAGGHWLLPKPLPVIIRDVTVVGSNVPGDHDEFLFKALHAPEPDNSAVHHFDGGGSRGRDRRHAHARHHDARPNPRTSFDEDMQKQGKGPGECLRARARCPFASLPRDAAATNIITDTHRGAAGAKYRDQVHIDDRVGRQGCLADHELQVSASGSISRRFGPFGREAERRELWSFDTQHGRSPRPPMTAMALTSSWKTSASKAVLQIEAQRSM